MVNIPKRVSDYAWVKKYYAPRLRITLEFEMLFSKQKWQRWDVCHWRLSRDPDVGLVAQDSSTSVCCNRFLTCWIPPTTTKQSYLLLGRHTVLHLGRDYPSRDSRGWGSRFQFSWRHGWHRGRLDIWVSIWVDLSCLWMNSGAVHKLHRYNFQPTSVGVFRLFLCYHVVVREQRCGYRMQFSFAYLRTLCFGSWPTNCEHFSTRCRSQNKKQRTEPMCTFENRLI